MGNPPAKPMQQVKQIASMCKYNKQNFQERIDILRDAHSVMQYYADILLKAKMPTSLGEYRNYTESSEQFFNTRRKDQISDLQAINPKINNYYDLYNAILNLQNEYERGDITENERRSKITDVFNLTYSTLKALIEELWESCDIQ